MYTWRLHVKAISSEGKLISESTEWFTTRGEMCDYMLERLKAPKQTVRIVFDVAIPQP